MVERDPGKNVSLFHEGKADDREKKTATRNKELLGDAERSPSRQLEPLLIDDELTLFRDLVEFLRPASKDARSLILPRRFDEARGGKGRESLRAMTIHTSRRECFDRTVWRLGCNLHQCLVLIHTML
jgi:hypothetical protein